MEQARLFLAIVLSFLVFIFWDLFFNRPEPPVDHPQSQTQTQTPGAKEVQSPKSTAQQPFQEAPPEKPAQADVPGFDTESPAEPGRLPREIEIRTQFYTARISEMGGVFKSLTLNQYKETNAGDSPLKELVTAANASLPCTFGVIADQFKAYDHQLFNADTDADVLDATQNPQSLNLVWHSPQGFTVVKQLRFMPDQYLIDLDVRIQNQSTQTLNRNFALALSSTLEKAPSRLAFEGVSAIVDNKLEEVKLKDEGDAQKLEGQFKWIAVGDRYFISCLIPEKPANTMAQLVKLPENTFEARYAMDLGDIAPQSSAERSYKLFFGPKQLSLLSDIGYDLKKAIHFGWFDFLAKPCLLLMTYLYRIIPNYGVAIIVLTLLIKAVLWPLGNKSYKSMNEMKKLQPLMAQIREKYGNDKRKMNEELMGLYKTYKINPLGGCLPMVLQFPVFIALYRMLYQAIELRHAPFFLWINDLSAPDRLLSFDFAIPFMDPPYGIPVLTIVMGATMLLQQKMSPPPGDPTQAKMMMIMPVVFTVIFINFSSGLVLYWLVSNLLSIAQQYYVSKKNA